MKPVIMLAVGGAVLLTGAVAYGAWRKQKTSTAMTAQMISQGKLHIVPFLAPGALAKATAGRIGVSSAVLRASTVVAQMAAKAPRPPVIKPTLMNPKFSSAYSIQAMKWGEISRMVGKQPVPADLVELSPAFSHVAKNLGKGHDLAGDFDKANVPGLGELQVAVRLPNYSALNLWTQVVLNPHMGVSFRSLRHGYQPGQLLKFSQSWFHSRPEPFVIALWRRPSANSATGELGEFMGFMVSTVPEKQGGAALASALVPGGVYTGVVVFQDSAGQDWCTIIGMGINDKHEKRTLYLRNDWDGTTWGSSKVATVPVGSFSVMNQDNHNPPEDGWLRSALNAVSEWAAEAVTKGAEWVYEKVAAAVENVADTAVNAAPDVAMMALGIPPIDPGKLAGIGGL